MNMVNNNIIVTITITELQDHHKIKVACPIVSQG